MIDGGEKRNRQLAFELQNSHVCEKRGESLFAPFQTSPILFSFIKFGKSWRNFLRGHIFRFLSLQNERDNFCVVFTYSIKRARECRSGATTAKKCTKYSVMHLHSCCLLI